jgi:4-amino-4-deoxy-L-arabinose transferase-like glycosyltransferase
MSVNSQTANSSLRWAMLILLLALAVWLRWDVYPKTYFADELIPHAVVQHMQDTHTLDTNWEHADWRGDFAGGFYKLQQYNFSSYHTTLFFLRSFAGFLHLDTLTDLAFYRITSLVFQLVTLMLIFLTAKQLGGYACGLLAAAFFAVMPQPVIDAHYARPESFVMLLVMMAAWLALRANTTRLLRYHLLAAGIWGVAFACKVSFAPMALLAVLQLQWRAVSVVNFLAWLFAFFVGILLSAPYVVMDPVGFLHGIQLLLGQYNDNVPPADWLDTVLPSARELFPYVIGFFGWPAIFLCVVSLFITASVLRLVVQLSWLATLVYVLIFSHATVFFERNLSHLVPLWAICFALGAMALFTCANMLIGKSRYVARISVGVIVVAALFYGACMSWQIVTIVFHDSESLHAKISQHDADMQQKYGAQRVMSLNFAPDFSKLDRLQGNVLLRMPVAQPKFRDVVIELFAQHGYERVATIPMPLGQLPYNQLQVNHIPVAYEYYKRITP